MIIHQAKDVSHSLEGLREHFFRQAIVQKRAPGAYTYVFGDGKLAVEAVVSFLLTDTSNLGAMQKNIDALSKTLLDNERLQRVWNRLFPSQAQVLTPDQNLFSANDVQREFGQALGSKAITGITSTMTEVLIEALSGTRFVSRVSGYSFYEERPHRFPTKEQLARLFLEEELVAALRAEPLRIRFDAKKFTPAFLFDQFQQVCNRLGRLIAKIGYNYDALHDAMYVVFTGLNERGTLHDKLPKEVLDSAEYAELSTNLTFVLGAYSAAITRPRGADWTFRNALSRTLQVLNLSARYEIVSLATATAHCRYTSLIDPRSNLLGGVLSYAAPIKHPIDVVLAHQHVGSSIPLLEVIPLERYTEPFNALVSPVNGWDVLATAHEIVESIVTVTQVKETDDAPRSRLWQIDSLDERDLMHLAVLNADQVYLPRVTANGRQAVDSRFVFAKKLNGRRLFADDIPFEGRVFTTDAATLLLCCDSFDATIPFDMTGFAYPPAFFETLIVNDPQEILVEFGGSRDVDVRVAGRDLKVTISLVELTRQIEREGARLLRSPRAGAVLASAFRAIHGAYEWVLSTPSAQANVAVQERLRAQVSHQIGALYEQLASAGLFDGALDWVLRRLAKSVPPELRDETYMTLEQEDYRRQVAVELVGFVYETLQLLPKSETEDLHAKNVKLLRDAEYFARMLGVARAKRITG